MVGGEIVVLRWSWYEILELDTGFRSILDGRQSLSRLYRLADKRHQQLLPERKPLVDNMALQRGDERGEVRPSSDLTCCAG